MLKLKEGSVTNSGFTVQVDELPNGTEYYAVNVTATFANGTKKSTYKNITIHSVAEDTVTVTAPTNCISADGNYDFTLSYAPAGANVKVTSVKVTKATLTDMVEVVSASRDGFRIKVTGLDAAEERTRLSLKLDIVCTLSSGTALATKTITQKIDNRPGEYDYVDLGLPSGLLWATSNIGASWPEEYGLYFAWGDVVGYGQDTSDGHLFNWNTCPWGKDTPPMSTLDAEHDAATINMGADWRMPDKADYEELLNNCTTTWTTQNGINGRLFTSKLNGNTLFFPAAGSRDDSSLYGAGSGGSCWSRSLDTSNSDYAYNLSLTSSNCRTSSYYRYYGRSVRGVRTK